MMYSPGFVVYVLYLVGFLFNRLPPAQFVTDLTNNLKPNTILYIRNNKIILFYNYFEKDYLKYKKKLFKRFVSFSKFLASNQTTIELLILDYN